MNLTFLLFLFCIFNVSSRPSPPNNEEPATKKLKSDPECYFAKERRSPLETFARDSYSKVSQSCGGTLMKWTDVIGTFFGDFHGAVNEMDLLAARGGAEYPDFNDPAIVAEIGSRFICPRHLDELLAQWESIKHIRLDSTTMTTKHAKCGMPSAVSNHGHNIPKTPHGGTFLTRQEANRLLKEQHVHAHVGVPLCNKHKADVSMFRCVNDLESLPEISGPIATRLRSALTLNAPPETCQRGQQPSSPGTTSSNAVLDAAAASDGVCKSKFLEWAESLGLKFLAGRKPYNSLTLRSKRRKASATRELISAALELLAPGHAEELRALTFQHESDQWTNVRAKLFDDLMQNVVSEYNRQSTRKERRGILSLVATTLPYYSMLNYFPSLTKYEFTKARMHANLLDRATYTSQKRQKFDKQNVTDFVDFITSPLVRTDLPYGRRTLKKSDGTKLEISNTLRNLRAIEIVEMYIKMKSEKGEEDQLMSRSTLFKILEVCKATNREVLECVDYFLSDALDSFDKLSSHIVTLKENNYIDIPTAKDLTQRLHQAKLYLQTDFKLHLKFESKIGDHCVKYALSDPKVKMFNEECGSGTNQHDHKSHQCERCQAVRDVFEDFVASLKELIESAQGGKLRSTSDENIKANADLTLILNDVTTAEANILELKRHLVRNKHSSDVRQKIVDNLKPDEVFLTLDWAQKILPQRSRESQSEYFGKSGVSAHCSHALNIDSSGNLRQHSFIHVTQHETQDSITVLLIIESVLNELKKVGITRVHLRSDNAGCYHSAKTITSLPDISKRTGVKILSFTFSEVQGGKGAADRVAAEMKRKLRSWLSSGKDASTTEEIFTALTEGRVPNAMSTYLCSIDRSAITEGQTTIKGIQSYYDFWFNDTKNEMTARKFGLIGTGETTSTTKFIPSKGTLKIERSGGYVVTDASTFWKSSKCSGKCSQEDGSAADDVVIFGESDVDVDTAKPKPMETAVFTCPEEGCDATFLKYGNLEKHLETGKHKISPERETLLDVAMTRFADNVEGLKEGSISSILKDAFVELPAGSLDFVHEKGWAQPLKKSNKRYDLTVSDFVMKRFVAASKNKQKVYPKVIAQEIREKRNSDGTATFSPEQWLNHKQVMNLYQKFGKKAREMKKKKNAENEEEKENASTLSSASSLSAPDAHQDTSARTTSHRSGGKHNSRPKREETLDLVKVVEAVVEELNQEEYDDAEALYDTNGEENSDFENLMIVIENEKKEIFES